MADLGQAESLKEAFMANMGQTNTLETASLTWVRQIFQERPAWLTQNTGAYRWKRLAAWWKKQALMTIHIYFSVYITMQTENTGNMYAILVLF